MARKANDISFRAPKDSFDKEIREEIAKVRAQSEREAAQLGARTIELQTRIQETNEELIRLRTLSATPTKGQASAALAKQFAALRIAVDKTALDARAVNEQVSAVDGRLKNIETVILSDPGKALALPLLQCEIQAVSQQVDRGLASLKSENDRVYDLMKWVLGLTTLVSFGLLGTAVGNVFKREPSKDLSAAP